MKTIFIDDRNTKSQGMRNLLEYLTLEVRQSGVDIILISHLDRLSMLRVLLFEQVVFFGNYPSILSFRSKAVINFSNLNLTEKNVEFKWKIRQIYLQLILRRNHTVIVPTSFVKHSFEKRYKGHNRHSVKVIPFYESTYLESLETTSCSSTENIYYFGSNAPHKRVTLILKAFESAYRRGLNKNLYLTVPHDSFEGRKIKEMRLDGYPVINLVPESGVLSRTEVIYHLSKMHVCLYVSQRETFGYGLLEALYSGHCILVPKNQRYWEEVIDPSADLDMTNFEILADELLELKWNKLNKPKLKFQNNIKELLYEIGCI